MLIQFARRASKRKRYGRIALVLGTLVILVLAGPTGLETARTHYKAHKRDRALAQAEEFFKAKDMARAATALQVAIRADPRNPDVWKTIAGMTEAIGAREAIQQRQQVVALSPGDYREQITLALTAMRFGDIFTARDALAAVPQSFRGSADYRRAVALFAMIEGNGSTAEQVLASLMKSNPDERLRLSYATVRLSHPDPVVATSARQEIAGMMENAQLAPAALRELLGDAVLRKDFTAARAWADRLVMLPGAEYNDHLTLGTLLLLLDKKPLDEVLPSLRERAGDNPSRIADLMRWLLVQRNHEKARELVDALPAEQKDAFVMKAVRVDLAIARRDWAGMGELIYQGALGPVPDGALRLAMEARNVGDLQGPEARLVHWKRAIEATRTNIFGLRVLYQLGVTWKWPAEVEAVLLAIAQGFTSQTWAHEALVRVYTVERNGPGLQQIFSIWQQQQGNINRLKHDSALMDLLVLSTATSMRARQAAETLHLNEPANPNYATTCAFSYALFGRTKEAMAVVSKLKPADRRDPARAHYLAFIYAKAGDEKLAREQLALVHEPALLKEEAALVVQARGKVDELAAKAREIELLTRGPALVPAPAKSVAKP
ncbi:MAG: hypothetical protein K0R17_2303 [Rariglobus sp.]|jgi:Tfp pilus assembly protein PilF|nr:hypothetical protein [Rariglobus sp.]